MLSKPEPVLCGVLQGSILGSLLFLLSFDDVGLVLSHCNIIMNADDTVIYTSAKDHNELQQKLSDDFNRVASWLESNDLIMNMKAGKTECMIFGTSQKIKNKELNIAYHHQSISKASTYKYLGLTLGQTLNLNDHLTQMYKKATAHLNLLRRLRYQLTEKAATTNYQSMLIPLFTYCSIVTCRTSMTYKHKVSSLESRAHEILFRIKRSNKQLPSTEHLMNKKLYLNVFKCINGDSCDNFNDYFEQ